jgi:RNAse (barnase) inhibitor barstar
MPTATVEIDGAEFSTLEEFFAHFQSRALDGTPWGNNLDAFNDVLRGGFGTPDGGFHLRWKNHQLSKQCLGWDETVRQLRIRLKTCCAENIPVVQEELTRALSQQGKTMFDVLVEIISEHGPGGRESEDAVVLELI